MSDLTQDQWRDLKLSVNVHRKHRRLSPLQAARYMRRALEGMDVDSLARKLNFTGTTTLRKILRLAELCDDVAATVDWGHRRGAVSMSTASEIMRLEDDEAIRVALEACAKHDITRNEARQIVQIYERSSGAIQEAIDSALHTRPKVERSEMIIGSLLTKEAQARTDRLGNEVTTKRLKVKLAKRFPDVVCQAVRVNANKFSLLLKEEDAQSLRDALQGQSVEATISGLIEDIPLED